MMKNTCRLITPVAVTLALVLTSFALGTRAQTPIEQPLDEAISVNQVDDSDISEIAPAGGIYPILDDFNRPNIPIGPRWTVHDGFCNISNNAAVCGDRARATFNYAPGDGNYAEADIEVNGPSLQYTGLLLNYGEGVTNLLLKVQASATIGKFTHAACYIGNGPDDFGLGYFSLTAHFAYAHMTAWRVGDVVTIEFTNVEGGSQPDQTYVCEGAPEPEGTGIGIVGYDATARLDNFAVGIQDITVNPVQLQVTLDFDQVKTQTINLCNVGNMPLNWNMQEVTDHSISTNTPIRAGSPNRPQPIALSFDGVESDEQADDASQNSEGAVALLLDDGSAEDFWTFLSTAEIIFVNRFTPDPGDFPLMLNEVRIYHANTVVGREFSLIVYENTTGGIDPAFGSNLRLTIPSTVQAGDEWSIYTLNPPLTFNGPGDVLIGMAIVSSPWNWGTNVDSSVNQLRSWFGFYTASPLLDPPMLPADTWELFNYDKAGNFLFRGYGETSGIDIPWLSESLTLDTLAISECAAIDVTIDSTGLTSGDYTGSLQVNSNDPDTPKFTVPVTLTVTKSTLFLPVITKH